MYLMIFGVFSTHAQNEFPSEVINKTEDFKINGTGDSGNWDRADWIDIPQRGKQGMIYETRVKSLYSQSGIYFLFHCEDEIITSTLSRDFDDLWTEDVIEVFLWTEERHPIYFEYELSPRNYELPILVPNFDGDFLGWRPWNYNDVRKVEHATFVEKQDGKVLSWRGEFFIPYELLKPLSNVPPSVDTRWRVNMYRMDYDTDRSIWSWSPVETTFHEFERFGTFIFK